jgi:TonB family protein
MKRLLNVTVALLFLFSLAFTLQIRGQRDRDPQPDKELTKLFEACVTPDRPKPEVEVTRKLGLCGKAINLPKPPYPEEAKAQNVSGRVRIEIVIDEEGRVIWAKPIEGHLLLLEASVRAACNSRYSPERISGRAVKVGSEISYNFVVQ